MRPGGIGLFKRNILDMIKCICYTDYSKQGITVMSNQINDNLMERAYEMADYWEGTIIASVIRHDLEVNDMEALMGHVTEAESDASRQEHHVNDVY